MNEDKMKLEVLMLAGRCNNGANRTQGRLYHLVPNNHTGIAICGARPGKRSVGWYTWEDDRPDEPTCQRCIKKRLSWCKEKARNTQD